jgi:hypothetical protein
MVVVMPLSVVLENLIAISDSTPNVLSSVASSVLFVYLNSVTPEIEISAAIADTDVIATRAVDARRILRILNLPKDCVAGIGNFPKILKNT